VATVDRFRAAVVAWRDDSGVELQPSESFRVIENKDHAVDAVAVVPEPPTAASSESVHVLLFGSDT
jgi:hypothetical protein